MLLIEFEKPLKETINELLSGKEGYQLRTLRKNIEEALKEKSTLSSFETLVAPRMFSLGIEDMQISFLVEVFIEYKIKKEKIEKILKVEREINLRELTLKSLEEVYPVAYIPEELKNVARPLVLKSYKQAKDKRLREFLEISTMSVDEFFKKVKERLLDKLIIDNFLYHLRVEKGEIIVNRFTFKPIWNKILWDSLTKLDIPFEVINEKYKKIKF